MPNPRLGRTSIERLEIIERESGLRKAINEKRFQRQNLINEIKSKRNMATELREKRDSLNQEVRELITQAKEHIKKRDKINGKIKELKEKRMGITKGIKPKADRIRSEKQERRQLNQAARTSSAELITEFEASLKTLLDMELALKDEVIMVEMVMEIQKRYNARLDAENLTQDIHKTWVDIKGIEEHASQVTRQIISLASEGENEHQKAMELFDKKNEISSESREIHESFVDLTKEIKKMSKQIDTLSQEIDERFKELKPLKRRLDNLRLTRREEQRLEKLKTAKHKMETTGKLGLDDLRILIEEKAIPLEKGDEKEKRKHS